MSITDIAAGRMPHAPARPFGGRRAPSPPVRPRAPKPDLWAPARGFLAGLPALLQHRLQALALALSGMLKPSEAWSREAAIRALLRSNASATFVRLLAYVGALALLALGAAHMVRSTPASMAAEPAPRTEWVQIAKPFPAFALPMPEFSDRPDYALRRHAIGGGRQDALTWGDIEGDGPQLTVEIYRPAAEFQRFKAPEREVAMRAEGVSPRDIKPAGTMESKFGTVSLVEFSLPRPERQCLGFVRAFENPPLQILGWHCTKGPEPVERDLAACALDRLTLLAAGSEPKVRELFARAELKRTFCGQRSHLLAATPKLGPAGAAPHGRGSSR